MSTSVPYNKSEVLRKLRLLDPNMNSGLCLQLAKIEKNTRPELMGINYSLLPIFKFLIKDSDIYDLIVACNNLNILSDSDIDIDELHLKLSALRKQLKTKCLAYVKKTPAIELNEILNQEYAQLMARFYS